LGLFVTFLHFFDVGEVSEVEVVDLMAHIEGFDDSIHSQPHIYVLVCVATDMKVAWHFLDAEGSDQPAAIVRLEGLFRYFNLLLLVGFSKELKVSGINLLSI
jgi:hypothetical protein